MSTVSKLHWQGVKMSVLASKFPGDHNENLLIVTQSTDVVTLGYAGCTMHTRQSSTQNNKYQESQKHSFLSWWWAHSRQKHVKIDRCIKNKLCTKLVLFTRLFSFHIAQNNLCLRFKSKARECCIQNEIYWTNSQSSYERLIKLVVFFR